MKLLLSTAFALVALSAAAQGPITETTSTGAVYTRDTSEPKLGEAWRDPRGLIWGDIVRDSRTGDPVEPPGAYEASNYCRQLLKGAGYRLPTLKEIFALRKDMGDTKTFWIKLGRHYFPAEGYKAQILPNMNGDIWTDTVYGLTKRNGDPILNTRPPVFYAFDTDTGAITLPPSHVPVSDVGFRCVKLPGETPRF